MYHGDFPFWKPFLETRFYEIIAVLLFYLSAVIALDKSGRIRNVHGGTPGMIRLDASAAFPLS